jgi:hypothetical protein
MAAARNAAVLLILLATALSAQDTSTGQIVITVIDQSGARVPGAHIGIIQLPSVVPNNDWLPQALHTSELVSTRVNGSGEATIGLAKGSYAIEVDARGFKRYFERIEVGNESNKSIQARLIIDPDTARGDCMSCTIVIPLEPMSLNPVIPLESLQTITLKPARIGRK